MATSKLCLGNDKFFCAAGAKDNAARVHKKRFGATALYDVRKSRWPSLMRAGPWGLDFAASAEDMVSAEISEGVGGGEKRD